MHQLDVAAGCCSELFKVAAVDGHDFVPVRGERHDCGVDHIGRACCGQELPSGTPKCLVQCPDIDSLSA
jgi:hypothetical protein